MALSIKISVVSRLIAINWILFYPDFILVLN
nr:MAG TPA: hypothetical protein [Ackermannviridae sp.]